jgi:predicted nucleic acid-binding protein
VIGVLRRRKPAERIAQLAVRPRSELIGATALSGGPMFLLLDTNVYISRASGRLARAVSDIIDQALLFHCSVALAELAIGVANADPSRPGWAAMRDHYGELFSDIPSSRIVTPDAQIWIDAGVIAGTLARTQRFQP